MKARHILVGSLGGFCLLAAGVGGYVMGHHGALSSKAAPSDARKPLYWVSAMDPSIHSDKPGKDPMGMDFTPYYGAAVGGENDASDVTISPQQVQQLAVQTAVAREGAMTRGLAAVGYVAYDEDRIVSINTRAEGWIEKLQIKAEGDPVRKGQLLYALFSPKIATAEREYRTALISGMPSLVAASHQRLQSLGVPLSEINEVMQAGSRSDRVARYAPQSGVITQLDVREGAYVMPANPVMKIADLSSVWVMVEVNESDVTAIRPGQTVTAWFDALPGQSWRGTVDYIYPDIADTTRTAKVRLRFANPDLRLRPGMYAHIDLAEASHTAVTIPESALIRTGTGDRVVLALGQGKFDVCPVTVGDQNGDTVAIIKGLAPGRRVVTASQFLIDSEANIDEATLHINGGQQACRLSPDAASPGMPVPKPAPHPAPAPAGGMGAMVMPKAGAPETGTPETGTRP